MCNKKLLIETMLAHDCDFAVRCMMKLYELQTLDEQVSEHSIHRNQKGFNSSDAPILSVYAERIRNDQGLTPQEFTDLCTRMVKYATQLLPMVKDEELE